MVSLSARPADAQAPPETFEDDPAIAAGVDGPVWVSELIGDELWIGGEFTSVRNAPFASPSVPTTNLAVININTGNLVFKTFDFDGPVYGIEYHDGIVWVVGNFDNLNGQFHQNIVAIDFATNQVINSFVAASNAQLRDVEYHDGWLYLAGNVSAYNGTNWNPKVLRVNPVTGALDSSWVPEAPYWIEGIDLFGSTIVATERATSVGGETRVISTITGIKSEGLDPAHPTIPANPLADRGNWDTAFAPDGQNVYTASLNNRVWKHTVSDLFVWATPRVQGDVQAVAATNSRVFAGFHEGYFVPGDDIRLVAFFASNGTLDSSWDVEMNSYIGVRDIQIYDQGLVATGEFSNVNDINARRVAIFRPNGAWNPAEPVIPARVTPPGDVDCSEAVDLTDARYILDYVTDQRSGTQLCPVGANEINESVGDVDDDGTIDSGDALMIAQCHAGISNAFCP